MLAQVVYDVVLFEEINQFGKIQEETFSYSGGVVEGGEQVIGLFLLTAVHFSKPGHVVEQQLSLPENMYGDMCALFD